MHPNAKDQIPFNPPFKTGGALARGFATAIAGLVAIAGFILLLLYLQGTFGGQKVGPGLVAPRPHAPPEGKVVRVIRREIEDILTWPGTVRSRAFVNVAPKLTARILEVKVDVGDRVSQGQVIAVLDDRELRARAGEARAAIIAAEAQARHRLAEERRTRRLLAKEAATQQELDAILAQAKSAQATLAQARESSTQTQVLLGESVLRAPFAGAVVERLADPGEMGMPGKPIVTLQGSGATQIELHVPTHCAQRIRMGQALKAQLDTREAVVMVEEVAPSADPSTRTVAIKAGLPPDAGAQPGQFAWVLQACGRHEALLIPSAAVVRVGQIEQVKVMIEDEARVRLIRTGKRYGEEVEVLSGLREGERVAVEIPPSPPFAKEGMH